MSMTDPAYGKDRAFDFQSGFAQADGISPARLTTNALVGQIFDTLNQAEAISAGISNEMFGPQPEAPSAPVGPAPGQPNIYDSITTINQRLDRLTDRLRTISNRL